MQKNGPLILVGTLAGLYFAACVNPALLFGGKMFRGLSLLVMGWFPPTGGMVPWSANLVFLVGLVFLHRTKYRTACLLGLIASLLGAAAWRLPIDFEGLLLG